MLSSVPKNSAMRRLELLVQVLGAADEAHRRHAEAVALQRLVRGRDHLRVVGQPEVVVGAEVQHPAPVLELDLGRLRAGDDPLGLEQAVGADRSRVSARRASMGLDMARKLPGQSAIIRHPPISAETLANSAKLEPPLAPPGDPDETDPHLARPVPPARGDAAGGLRAGSGEPPTRRSRLSRSKLPAWTEADSNLTWNLRGHFRLRVPWHHPDRLQAGRAGWAGLRLRRQWFLCRRVGSSNAGLRRQRRP